MLDPDPASTWAIPRAFAVDVCPLNYRRAINIDSGHGVILDATPDLFQTLKISTKPKVPPSIALTGTVSVQVSLFSRTGAVMYPQLLFRDASGNYFDLPYFMVDDPDGVVLLRSGNFSGDGSYENGVVPVFRKKLIYAASNANVYANTNAAITYTGTTPTSLTQTMQVLDQNFSVLGSDSLVTNNPVSGTNYSNVNGIGQTGVFFTFSLSITNGSSPANISFISADIGTNLWTLDFIETKTYGPSPDITGSLYRSVVESSSKYSFPLLSMLVTFVGSDLLNGGNIAIGVVPNDYPLSLVPEVAYSQICALGGRYYSGPMKNGAHGMYIPDDLTRIAFYPTDEPILGRRLCVAILPQQVVGGPSSSVTMRIELRSHIEFINASQTLAHMTSNCYAVECVESMFAAMDAEHQVGENPKHLKRLAEIAKTVARDPRTKELAIKALKYIGKGALAATPLLLA